MKRQCLFMLLDNKSSIRTRPLLIDETDALDGAVLLKLPPQLLLGGVVANAPHKQRLEGVALQVKACISSHWTTAGQQEPSPRECKGESWFWQRMLHLSWGRIRRRRAVTEGAAHLSLVILGWIPVL